MPFQKGTSGNVNGRPSGVVEWRKGPMAQRMNALAKTQLEDIARDGYLMYRHPQTDAVTYAEVEPRERIAALKEILDRTEGKPTQAITGEDGGAIKVDNSAGLLEVLKRLAGDK